MATPDEPIDLRALVVLLYRADWTQLCLSARATTHPDYALPGADSSARRAAWRYPGLRLRLAHRARSGEACPRSGPAVDGIRRRVLLAPGGRCRIEVMAGAENYVVLSDGQSLWDISEGVAEHGVAEHGVVEHREAAGPPYPLAELLTPSRLVTDFDLDVTGTSAVGGRTAHRVVATPRPVARTIKGPDHVIALIDAELGILLSYQEISGGKQLHTAELAEVLPNPAEAADPALFLPPPGMPVHDHQRLSERNYAIPGAAGQIARRMAGPAAAAVGFAVRHAPVRSPQASAGTGDAIPDPGRGAGPGRAEPVTDELVNLLHRTGLPAPAFTAVLHDWTDAAAMFRLMSAMSADLPPVMAGLTGPDQMWDAFGDRMRGTTHQIRRLTVAMPDKYRIDHLAGAGPRQPTTIACDGRQIWKIYPNRVATGPARPPESEIAQLTDRAPLLSGCELAAAGEVEVDGRRGFLVIARGPAGLLARSRAGGSPGLLSDHVEMVIDAELGIVLRETVYLGDKPARLVELRDVTSQVDPGAFRIEVPAGARTVGAGPFSDWDSPAPLKAAKVAAGLGAAGVAALSGWLQKRPRS